MKKNCCLVLGVMLSTSLVAQQAPTPPTSAPPAAVAPAPAATKESPAKVGNKKAAVPAAKKKAPAEKKPAAPVMEKPVVLVAGPAVVASGHVNVRGQASLKGEVITRLSQGDAITVIEQINLEKPHAGEPAQWAKIAFPASAHVWVNASFIDATSKTVVPKKLNLRAGPGENYSVVGLIEKGAPVRELATKNNWMEIEAPANAYAFVAAEYLKQEAPVVAAATAPAPPPPAPAPAPTPVAEAPALALAPVEAPAVIPAPTPTETPAAPPAAPVAAEPAPTALPVVEEPPPVRIVSHEGVVRGTRSIQAPTKFEIFDPASGKTIDYLYTTSVNLDLSRYKGLRIIVTGEEGLDDRWGNTPVITVQRIRVVE